MKSYEKLFNRSVYIKSDYALRSETIALYETFNSDEDKAFDVSEENVSIQLEP